MRCNYDAGDTIIVVDVRKFFCNYREGKDIKVTKIDISELVENGKLPLSVPGHHTCR
jgi:hypothetical protein